MLDLDRVDLGELCSALEDNSPEHAWWLDPVNGALELRSAYFDDLEEKDKEPSERGLIVIDPLGSHEAYADMEDFATSVLDPRARDLLMRAIELERMDAVLWRHSLANDTVVTELPVSEGEYQQSDEPLLARVPRRGRSGPMSNRLAGCLRGPAGRSTPPPPSPRPGGPRKRDVVVQGVSWG